MPWLEIVIGALVGLGLAFMANVVLGVVARGPARPFARHVRKAVLTGGPLLGAQFALGAAGVTDAGLAGGVRHGVSIALIACATWVVVSLVEAMEELVRSRYPMEAGDNLQARRVQTQMRVLVRTAQILVMVLGAAGVLMTFPSVREFGASLLASAGIAGLVVGLAARPAVANLIAGVQIALSQPIRLDDVVIVEGEWGRIEEITSTYVVVRVWDERRLVVPLHHFIERPFQNWTRTSSQLLGGVELWLDYRTPVDALRAELGRFVAGREEWDRRVANVQVIDTTERTMKVRALVSGADSGSLWNLRCAVREHLIAHLQREHPGSLPRLRAEVEGEAAAGA